MIVPNYSIIPVIVLAAMASGQIVLHASAGVPLGASQLVDHSFPSFAIQPSSFPHYAGIGSPADYDT